MTTLRELLDGEWTGAQLLVAVLKVCPAGSRLHLDQCEPASWRTALAEWAVLRAGVGDVDHYRVEPALAVALERLLHDDPAGLEDCPHVYIASPEGEPLLTCHDDFDVVRVSPALLPETKMN